MIEGSAEHDEAHTRLLALMTVLPTDYSEYGGTIVRWADDDIPYPDCSCGCKWALPLQAPLGSDWVVCGKPRAPRSGLLTFEHQTGSVCFEEGPDDDDPQGEHSEIGVFPNDLAA